MIFVITTKSTQPRIRFLQKSLINPTTMGIKKKKGNHEKKISSLLVVKKKINKYISMDENWSLYV